MVDGTFHSEIRHRSIDTRDNRHQSYKDKYFQYIHSLGAYYRGEEGDSLKNQWRVERSNPSWLLVVGRMVISLIVPSLVQRWLGN